MRFVQTLTYRCDICGREHNDRIELFGLNVPLPSPAIPIGWREIQGRLVCPGHYVKVVATVDGTELQ